MDGETHSATTQAPGEWPVGAIAGFSAVFVVGFAVIAAVVMSRRRRQP